MEGSFRILIAGEKNATPEMSEAGQWPQPWQFLGSRGYLITQSNMWASCETAGYRNRIHIRNFIAVRQSKYWKWYHQYREQVMMDKLELN